MTAEGQQLVVEICQKLHQRGEALIPGTGLALKQGDLVFVPPADVHLDRLESEDIFTFNSEFDSTGNPELNAEATNPCHNISAYTSLFLKLFQDFDCGCVFYAQPKSAVVIGEIFDKFYKIKNNQLITQISNGETKEQYPMNHELKVPIINNRHDQTSLFKVLEKAFEANPQTNAVLIKGNGLFVCGDTWQETKLMYETLLRLFDVSIELAKVGKTNLGKPTPIEAPVTSTKTNKIEAKDIEIIEPKKVSRTKITAPRERTVARQLENKTRVGGGGTRYGRDSFPRRDDMALRSKRMALARLRMNNTGRQDRGPTGRMTAASFMGNQNMDNSYNNAAPITIGNRSEMNMGMGSANNMNTGMNQMNNMNMNQMNNMGMGINQMNNMNMNQGNNMMANQQGMMNMNQGNMQMNMGMMEMGMNQGMFNGNQDMGNQGFNNGMGNMGNMNVEFHKDNSGGRSSGMFKGLARGQGYPRGRSISPRQGRPYGRGANRGSVKERLGFKSNISVDPSQLDNVDLNEEDY